jgi:Tol biopolymer transport system component
VTVARFQRILAAAVVSLAGLTVALLMAGDRTEPVPLTVQPADGERGVSGASSIVLRFGRPVEWDAVAAHLAIEPPTVGALEVDRAIVRFVPTGQLRPSTRYEVVLRAGFEDVSGRRLRQDRRFSFETRPARLVFSRPEGNVADVLAPRNLWVTTLDGDEPRPLTREPLGILFAAVAPDGERLVYSSPDPAAPDSSAVWIVGLDGTGRQKLAGDPDGAILALNWSPRGDLIAYERRAVVGPRGELGRPRILAVRPDGAGGGLLYGRGDEAGSLPVWSPDGRRLAVFEAGRGGRAIVDPAGGPVFLPSGGTDSGSWSPDGSLFAFADLVEEPDATRSAIRIADLAGSIVADLGRPSYSDTAPAWSPDGRSIAVVGRREDGETAIWLLDPRGESAGRRAVEVLPAGPASAAQYTPPVWAPGGAYVAFSRLEGAAPGARSPTPGVPLDWEHWVADGDGANVRRLPVDGLAEAWAP